MRSTFDLRRNPDPHGRRSASSMSECGVQVIRSGSMSKVTAKKRNVEEGEEQLPMFDEAGHLDDCDEENEDLSDSEESVFSGLEDSGSDDDDDDDEEEEEEEEEGCDGDDDVETDSVKEGTNVNEMAKSMKKTSESSFKPQAEDKAAKVTKLRKEKSVPEEGEGVEKSGKSGTDSGLTLSSQVDEYEQDTSDEEDIRNTVGNIPMEWYKDYPHIGYDLDGKKIFKPIRTKDELDEFLDKMENPDYWRTVHNKMTGTDLRLSDEQVDLVHRLQQGKFGDVNFNEYEPAIDFFSSEVMIHPVTNRPEDKRSFIPSLIEKEKVGKLVHAIKMGWIKPRRPKETAPKYYDLWAKEDLNTVLGRHKMHIPAPKMRLPGHEESYNPPPEYLLTEEERLAWEQQDPEDRRVSFLPQKYSCLRAVPAFSRFIHERFERCLDLYLCPRQRKMRVNVNPEDLIPKLPKPKDLQPFPTTQSLVYRGHTSLVRSISVSPSGQWLVSGSDDCTVRFWEVSTARCLKTVEVSGAVKSVAWSPNPAVCLVAISYGETIVLLNPGLGDKFICSATDQLISSYEEPEESKEQSVQWTIAEGSDHEHGQRAHSETPPSSLQVVIHQVSKRRTQNPFRKSKGMVQCVSFHPIRPYFFVATQRYVRVYNLIKQELTKKLMPNCKWISSMAVHPGAGILFAFKVASPLWDHKHHKKALRGVAYHKHYPLFASGSDDGSVIVCHGMVYNDLLQNPLIVPVKVLKGHTITHDLGVLDVAFHPSQPWVFSSGADGTVRLFT
ncbi:hypothetical protein SRHO_G00318720 [Serrasalmus rhombeus]